MRRLVAALVCIGVFSAQAQTTPQMFAPSPVSIAITIGQWLMKDSRKLYYIEVQSTADTFEAAKAEGFRLAVEYAVGTLVLSETEASQDRLRRNEIITYASGYVDQFKITNRNQVGNRVQLNMQVWVAHSAIANRLLNESKRAGVVDGEQADAQIRTITHQRQSADRVLNAVLSDFPKRAFDIQLEPTRIELDSNRVPHLFVVFWLKWNTGYLGSLGEAVRAVNQRAECNRMFVQCRARSTVRVEMHNYSKDPQAWFDDDYAWNLMQQHLIQSRPSLQVTIRNQSGRHQFRQCFYAPELDYNGYASWHYTEIGPGSVVINGLKNKRYNVAIPLQNIAVDQLDQVEIRVVKGNTCG